MAKTRTFKAGDKIRLKDKHDGQVDTYTVVKSEFKYNASVGDDVTHITIKGADGKQHQMTLDDLMDELVESKKMVTRRPKFQSFIKEETMSSGEVIDVLTVTLDDMAGDFASSQLRRMWMRGLQSGILTIQRHSEMRDTPEGKQIVRFLQRFIAHINTLVNPKAHPYAKTQAAVLLAKEYSLLVQLQNKALYDLEEGRLNEGFDDDDDLPTKVTVNIPDVKLKAATAMIKAMNPQKQGYAERILDWIKSGAKAGSRPSAISFGLGGFSASSVEQAFQAIDLWPKKVKI